MPKPMRMEERAAASSSPIAFMSSKKSAVTESSATGMPRASAHSDAIRSSSSPSATTRAP